MELFNHLASLQRELVHMPVVHSPLDFNSKPQVFTSQADKDQELIDEREEYKKLKDAWIRTHGMTEQEFDDDEDLATFLHSKAWKKAEQTMNDRILEREAEERRLAAEEAERKRLEREQEAERLRLEKEQEAEQKRIDEENERIKKKKQDLIDRQRQEKFEAEERERERQFALIEEKDRKKEERLERIRKEKEAAEEKWRNENELERLKDEIRKIEEEAEDIGDEIVDEFGEEIPSIDKIE